MLLNCCLQPRRAVSVAMETKFFLFFFMCILKILFHNSLYCISCGCEFVLVQDFLHFSHYVVFIVKSILPVYILVHWPYVRNGRSQSRRRWCATVALRPGEMDIWSLGEKKKITVEARLLTKNNLSLKLKSETSSSLCIGATFLGFPAQTLLMICVLTWILFTAVVNALKGTVFGNKCLVTMFRDLDHRLWSSWWFDSFKLSFFEQIYELLAKWSET